MQEMPRRAVVRCVGQLAEAGVLWLDNGSIAGAGGRASISSIVPIHMITDRTVVHLVNPTSVMQVAFGARSSYNSRSTSSIAGSGDGAKVPSSSCELLQELQHVGRPPKRLRVDSGNSSAPNRRIQDLPWRDPEASIALLSESHESTTSSNVASISLQRKSGIGIDSSAYLRQQPVLVLPERARRAVLQPMEPLPLHSTKTTVGTAPGRLVTGLSRVSFTSRVQKML